MFIKKITKPDRKGEINYTYYRLVHSYKIGDKNRQQTIINLGSLNDLDKKYHKLLADTIEGLLSGANSIQFDTPSIVEELAEKFSKKIISKGVFPEKKKSRSISTELPTAEYQEVDTTSMEEFESKSIGGEWLVKQAFDKLNFAQILANTNMSDREVVISQKLLTAKLIHPSSELETERWLEETSGVNDLYDNKADNHKATRYLLYKAASYMYKHKEEIESALYSSTQNIFSQRSKVVIYDLTNMYFEGQMRGSEKANFGRSKQKQSGKRLIGLALSIDSLGFVRHSKIYEGNISEPETFKLMLSDVASQLTTEGEKPLIVMDAGIATEENLTLIKSATFNYDYVCVSRTKPTIYSKLTDNATKLSDNRGNTIEVTRIDVEDKDDMFLHIKSHQKQLKEQSMEDRIKIKFMENMDSLIDGLSRPRRMKKATQVHEKVGRIKKQFSKLAHKYEITYVEDTEKGTVTNITYKEIENKKRPKGEYFLRYTKKLLSDKEIWDAYNLTRDVEAVFRCLKTDLDIRPIHHQKDAYIEPHIWLSIIAYQFVNYIKTELTQNNINYSWSTIVNKMEVQRSSLQAMNTKNNGKLYTKLCTKPTVDTKSIFSALGFKERPFVRKSKVVTQQ
jgi:hypothetical protein